MRRDIEALASETFDVVIAGGGIYGMTLAWETARRGLKTALVEREDFGSRTSANSLKTIHGGLRYLQQLDFKRMRESVRERSLFLYLAPHLVRPLGCVLPTYGYAMKGNEVMRAGMLVNDIISMDRNWMPDPHQHIPAGRILSKRRMLELVPDLDPSGVRGGAFWTDAQMVNSERMGLSFLKAAVEQRARAANYVSMTGLLTAGGRISGIAAMDTLGGKTFEIKAPVVVNTGGGWVNKILTAGKQPQRPMKLSTAMNLIIRRRLLSGPAAGVYGRFTHQLPGGPYHGRHVLFLAPWRHYTLAGTYHRPYSGDPDDLHVEEKEIDAFLQEINSAIPGSPVRREEVSYFHKGFLPMDGVDEKNGEVNLTKQYAITDHGRQGGPEGLITVIGVKYTTARDVSAKVAQLAAVKAGKKVKPPSPRVRLTGGEIERIEDYLASAVASSKKWSEPVIRRLVTQYGTEFRKILELSEEKAFSTLIPDSESVLAAEIIHAVRYEMAARLGDVVLRRTDLGSGECPPDRALKKCAELMAAELGWTAAGIRDEIASVKALYRPRGNH